MKKYLFSNIFPALLPTICWTFCLTLFVLSSYDRNAVTAVKAASTIIITEVMYDPPGTDAGHEWIEIHNSGDESVDLSGWKLFENNANHGLVSISGGFTLGQGGYAIIADNSMNFQADWPQFSGTLFDSAFSLANTGETLALKDSSGAVVHEIIYDPALGAKGDGKSLSFLEQVWSAEVPTPGAPSKADHQDTSSGTDNTDNNQNNETQNNGQANSAGDPNPSPSTSGSTSSSRTQKKITATLGLPSTFIVADATIKLTPKVTGTDGQPARSGHVYWNFGDGQSLMTSNIDSVGHVFDYPGRYVVYFEYYENYYDHLPKVSARSTILVSSSNIDIDDNGPTLSIKNESKAEIDISGCIIAGSGTTFTFPPATFLLAGSMIVIDKKKVSLPESGDYALYFPSWRLISHAQTKMTEVQTRADLGSVILDLSQAREEGQKEEVLQEKILPNEQSEEIARDSTTVSGKDQRQSSSDLGSEYIEASDETKGKTKGNMVRSAMLLLGIIGFGIIVVLVLSRPHTSA